MSKFIGFVLADGEATWSDDRWRLTQAVLAPASGGDGLPDTGELVARVHAQVAGTSEWLLVCSLTRQRPACAFDLSLDSGACIGFEVVSGSDLVVHLVGWRLATPGAGRVPVPPGFETLMYEEADEGEVAAGEGEFARRAADLNAEREAKRRRSSVESAAGSIASSSGTPRRTPRLTFNPHVLVAEYTPKKVGISPVRGVADLSQMEKRAVHRQATELLLPLHPLVKPKGSVPPSQPLPLRQPTCSAARAVPAHSPSPARRNSRPGPINGPGSENGPGSGSGPGSGHGPSPGSKNGPLAAGPAGGRAPAGLNSALGAAEMQQRMTSLIAAEAGCMAAGRAGGTGGGAAARGGDSLERLASDLRRKDAAGGDTGGGTGGDTGGGTGGNTGGGGAVSGPLAAVFRLLLTIRGLALRGAALETAEAIDDLQRECGASAAACRPSPVGAALAGRGLSPALEEACHALMQAVGPAVASGGRLGGRARLAAVMQVDSAYFSLLYSELTDPANQPLPDRLAVSPRISGGGAPGLVLLDPASFLRASHPPAFGTTAMADVLGPARALPPGGWLQQAASALAGFYTEGGGAPARANPLLSLWRLRLAEAAELLHASGAASQAAYAKNSPRRSPSRDKEPAAPPLVRKWRRAEREWPCWMLAFAVPSEQALDAIAKLRVPVVEMGAGVGYWAELLRRRGVTVDCYDCAPTSAGQTESEHKTDPPAAVSAGGRRAAEAGNTFHGLNPPWGPVALGTARALASKRFDGHALFLCYPPPRAPMAAECLLSFRGSVLVHVGEWLGDTGSPAFEQALADGWEMQLRLPLPCWGDTVEDLSIWRRRPQQSPKQNPKQSPKQKEPKPAAAAGAATVHPTLKCDECGKEGTLRPPQKLDAPGVLRRCRYCRLACYCSQACAQRGVAAHAAYHRLKMVGAPPPTNLSGDEYHTVCV